MKNFSGLLVLVVALLAGCQSHAPDDYVPTLGRFFVETEGGAAVMTLPQSGVRLPVAPKPVLTEFDFVDVQVAQVELGRCLMFRLTAAAARDLYRLSVPNQGRRLVLVINGAPVGARRIDRPMDDGAVLIFAEVPDESLMTLAGNLRRTSAELQRSLSKS